MLGQAYLRFISRFQDAAQHTKVSSGELCKIAIILSGSSALVCALLVRSLTEIRKQHQLYVNTLVLR